MKKINLIIIICLLSFNLKCSSSGFSLIKGEAKLADEIAKIKKESMNIRPEINNNKKEQNIDAEKVEIKEDNKTENTGLKISGKTDNSNTVNNAQKIENKSGLSGSDILYIFIGISIFLCVIVLIFAIIIKVLQTKYREKNLLKAAINDIKTRDTHSAIICNDIINKYDVFKTMLNFK